MAAVEGGGQVSLGVGPDASRSNTHFKPYDSSYSTMDIVQGEARPPPGVPKFAL
jgi:hypothetical protein